jgi:Skp family chaperone for outer membrane proteins
MTRLLLCCLFVLPLIAVEGTPVIATVDFEAFLKNSNLLGNRFTKLQAEIDEANGRFSEMASRIKKLETRIGMTEQSDPGYDVLVQDLETAKLRIKIAQNQAKERLEQRKAEMTQASIQEALTLLEAYCDEQKIDLVIQSGGADSRREVPIATMPVLYASARFDITEDFLAFANAKTPADKADKAPAASVPVLEGIGEDQQ